MGRVYTAELRYVEVVGIRKKYFDIGMVGDTELGIMRSQHIRFKKNAYIQAALYRLN